MYPDFATALAAEAQQRRRRPRSSYSTAIGRSGKRRRLGGVPSSRLRPRAPSAEDTALVTRRRVEPASAPIPAPPARPFLLPTSSLAGRFPHLVRRSD